MIENREFGVVILRASFYPEPVLDAINRAYEPMESVFMNGFDYIILQPNEQLVQTPENNAENLIHPRAFLLR
jgi:hypothetical protein